MPISTLRVLFCSLVLLWGVAAVGGQTVEAEGSATLQGRALDTARHQAMQDALRNAVMQAGARVRVTTRVAENVLESDDVKVSALGVVRELQVLDEWHDDESYHVLIRAQVEDRAATDASPTSRYRRKLAVTQFLVRDRRSIHDLPGIEIALAQELMRRLDGAGGILTLDATPYALPDAMGIAAAQGRGAAEVTMDLAETLGAQYLLSGVIRSAGVSDPPLGAKVRHIEFDVYVLDGQTGWLLWEHRFKQSAADWGPFKSQGPVLSAQFLAGAFGTQLSEAIDEAARTVTADLNGLPFTAHVVRVQDGRVYLDAGAASYLAVGDVLTAYQVSPALLRNIGRSLERLGTQETPRGRFVIRQVQPSFSIAEPEADAAPVQVGDLLRIGG